MLRFNRFNKLNENKKEKYPYEYIGIKIDDKEDVYTLLDFLDNLFDKSVNRYITNYYNHNVIGPSHVFIYSDMDRNKKIVENGDVLLFIYSTNSTDEDIIEFSNIPGQLNYDDIVDITELNKLKNLLLYGKKTSISTYTDNTKNRLVYESIDYSYPYGRILIWINGYEDLKLMVDYINKTFNTEFNTPHKSPTRVYDHLCLDVISMYKLMNGYSMIEYSDVFRFFSSDGFDGSKEEYINHIVNVMGYRYVNPNHTLMLNDLKHIPSLLKTGRKSNFNEIYNNSNKLVYESTEYVYPYDYVLFKVNSPDECEEIIKYIEEYYNMLFFQRDFTNYRYPNYLFVPSSDYNGFEYDCVIFTANSSTEEELIEYRKEKRDFDIENILTSNELTNYVTLVTTGRGKGSFQRQYLTPNKLVYESIDYIYPYDYIVVNVHSPYDIDIVYEYIENYYNITLPIRAFREFHYPNYFFIPTSYYKDFEYDCLIYSTEEITYDDIKKYYNLNKNFDINNILTVENLNSYDSLIKTGKKILPFKSIYSVKNKNIYENITPSTILNAFDMDETLVYSKRFEEHVKGLLLEFLTPTELFYDKIEDKGIHISKLKYENGRIYFDDPKKETQVDKYDTDWVRKKDRVYLTQPDEYLLTPESLPVETNENIKSLYEKSENKCIITARTEKSRNNIKSILKQLGISEPNHGLFMLKDKYSNKVKFKIDTILKLQEKNNFDVINYYDDNIRLLKRMKDYFNNTNININFYKVTKSDYRKI